MVRSKARLRSESSGCRLRMRWVVARCRWKCFGKIYGWTNSDLGVLMARERSSRAEICSKSRLALCEGNSAGKGGVADTPRI